MLFIKEFSKDLFFECGNELDPQEKKKKKSLLSELQKKQTAADNKHPRINERNTLHFSQHVC